MSDTLKHWGVLGMHWGQRRSRSTSSSVGPSSKDHERASSLRKKQLSEMSNDELRELATRMQLEKQVRDLTKKPSGKVQKILDDTATQLATEWVKKGVSKGAELLLDYALAKAGVETKKKG